ncbi:MAG: endonuclease MutS2 [Peptoniphilaceae bacterium]|nr:endonuclease MutS2 [Peptoniphilaceae bacterium]MDY6018458.1 endonuclease MutS2 [Anaerococcus sp.]
MQEKTLEVLEYKEVLKKIANKARSQLVKNQILEIKPISNIDLIKDELDKTDQMIKTLVDHGTIDLFGLYDLREIVAYASKNGILEPVDLLKVLDLLRVSSYLIEYGKNITEPYIKDIFDRIFTNDKLKDEIERSILSEDEISDNASQELRSIRRRKDKKEEEIKNRLNHYITSSKYEQALQDKVVTMREGRYVVPVKTNKKAVLNGIIHDKSASGNTIFVEPAAIVELNNQYSQLEIEENAEIRRILDRLSRMVEAFDLEILENQKLISRIDYLQAKSKYAMENNYSKPIVSKEKKINLIAACHPLLKGRVVPIDVRIGGDYTTLIITGPNTGGKTVSLKTVGLITLMAQSGLFIPCAEGSVVNVFDDIFLDIGDTQSIEMSLSTFSASLTNIVYLLNNITDNSLVLLDEVGSGTDPTEGAALAISILNYLNQKKVMTFATTHYSELKYYAIETPGVTNASVQFDVETLSPTYKLEIGTPGKSNAFEISQRLGLMPEILSNAKSILSEDNKSFNTILEQLEVNKKSLDEKNQEIEAYKRQIQKQKDALEEKIKNLEEERKNIIKEAEDKANDILKNANDQAQAMLKEAKKAKNANVSDIDRSLNDIRHRYKNSKIDRKSKGFTLEKSVNAPDTLKVGDIVLLAGLNEKAEVIEAPNEKGDIKVQIGILKMDSNIKNVTKLKSENKTLNNVKKVYNMKKSMHISPSLDLRGQRYDEALRNLDKYIDDVSLTSLNEVKIIHGKGTGALRSGIRDYLKNNNRIKDYRYGDDKEGGFGVTIVTFK